MVTGLTLSACLHACQQTAALACTSVAFYAASRRCRLSQMTSRGPGTKIINQTGWDYYEMTTGKRIVTYSVRMYLINGAFRGTRRVNIM